MDDDASIAYLDTGTGVMSVPIGAGQLQHLRDCGLVDDHTPTEVSVASSPYFRFTSSGGDITSMEQIFVS